MNERERREDGSYWVRVKEFYPEIWRPASYDAEANIWACAGVREAFYDSDYAEIGPRIPSPDQLEAADRVIEVARQIHATDLGALEELKGLGVDPSPQNSALTTALGVALQGLDATREKSCAL